MPKKITLREWLAHDAFVGACANVNQVNVRVMGKGQNGGWFTFEEKHTPSNLAVILDNYLNWTVQCINFATRGQLVDLEIFLKRPKEVK